MIALSSSPLDQSQGIVERLGLKFPVAYGLRIPEDAQKIDANFSDGNRKFFQATNFVLDSNGKVLDATYSTGPIGRINPADVLAPVSFFNDSR